ncbi:MAG: hypothetical protein J7518_01880 [Nocardioidaceae bacterium]|nr:hypothetical protein [Nocardioidaceae bacterium]
MNTITLEPAVRDFLDVVRADLADLDPEERREILDGLEADLGELVAEQGPDALGDPHAYARELRAAAGLDESAASARKRPIREAVTAFLDACHARFDAFVERLPADAKPVLGWLRPAWWMLRAWTAVQLVDVVVGDGPQSGLSLVPTLGGPGLPVLAVAVALSVLLGAGRIWPGGEGVGARVLLLGLNALGVVAATFLVPMAASGWQDPAYERGWQDGSSSQTASPSDGLSVNGEPVRNVYPYDAQGRPLTGVQLFDSSGHPLTLTNDPYNEGDGWGDFLLVPWLNGKTEQFNVFPLAEQREDPSTQEPVGTPGLQAPPFANVPPVTLAGVTPTRTAR